MTLNVAIHEAASVLSDYEGIDVDQWISQRVLDDLYALTEQLEDIQEQTDLSSDDQMTLIRCQELIRSLHNSSKYLNSANTIHLSAPIQYNLQNGCSL